MNTQARQFNGVLLQGVVEGLMDGVLILNAQGELVHSNCYGRLLCAQLAVDKSKSNLPKKSGVFAKLCSTAVSYIQISQ
ncbi:hypothetical protein [Moorena sp. SIO1F2]|uniref:hypothetical protein n=1 Tax=Moorena sp. SIO1F2 TaxID=2607819 RepID=UPI0025E67699|nr:hypothetical protein [Moorena sp. SIO1F2]